MSFPRHHPTKSMSNIASIPILNTESHLRYNNYTSGLTSPVYQTKK